MSTDWVLGARLRVVVKRYALIRIQKYFAVGTLVPQWVVVANIAGDFPRAVLRRVREQNGHATVRQLAGCICNSQTMTQHVAKESKIAAMTAITGQLNH